jgi:hypothetical protein
MARAFAEKEHPGNSTIEFKSESKIYLLNNRVFHGILFEQDTLKEEACSFTRMDITIWIEESGNGASVTQHIVALVNETL